MSDLPCCGSQGWRRKPPAYATFGTRASVVDKDGAAPSTERAEPIQSTNGRRLGMDWLSGTPVVRLHGDPTTPLAHDRDVRRHGQAYRFASRPSVTCPA